MNTIIRRIEFAPGSRIIVISDIHGHAVWLRRLLDRQPTGLAPIISFSLAISSKRGMTVSAWCARPCA